MKNNEKVLLGLIAGVAAGAVLGILLAPEKGSKTRRLIKEQSQKVVDDFIDKFEEGKEGIQSIKQEVVKTVKDAIGKLPAKSEKKPVASYESTEN